MSIQFFPFNIPISNSRALTSSLALSTPTSGLPVSAALAEFVVNFTGPTGPAGSITTNVTIL